MTGKIHVKHRQTARVLLYTPKNEILMLKTHFDPEVGLPPRWLIPGGGIDEGETALEAAVRELLEETGLKIDPDELNEPVLVAEGRWDWADGISYHTYQDTIFQYQIEKFDLNTSGFTADELRDVLEYKWWEAEEILETQELLGPHELRDYLRTRFIENR